MNLKLIILVIVFLLLNKQESFFESKKESFSETMISFQDFMDNHYGKIFSGKGYDRVNRNAAGFRFFKYFMKNLIKDENTFDYYNKFYCAVSGSIVNPNRSNNFSIIKMKDINGKSVVGRYYRCCTPCLSDIVKYARVVKTEISVKGKTFFRNLITIGDPCMNITKFIDQRSKEPLISGLDKRAFNCSNGFDNDGLTSLGLRVANGQLTEDNGRLVIGALLPLTEEDDASRAFTGCEDKIRTCSHPEIVNHLGGMGDIFVEMAQVHQPTHDKKLLKKCKCKSWYKDNRVEDRLKQVVDNGLRRGKYGKELYDLEGKYDEDSQMKRKEIEKKIKDETKISIMENRKYLGL
tara:strand:- start:1183 stop:2229 length:1047 start_codon:yes stop_codon:yes gene_type:complete